MDANMKKLSLMLCVFGCLSIMICEAKNLAQAEVQFSDNDFAVKLKKLLEEFRDNMTTPNPHCELPRLDPLFIQQLNFSTDNDELKLNATLKNITVEKLSTFEISHLEHNPKDHTVEFELFFPEIKISSLYNISVGNMFGLVGENSTLNITVDKLRFGGITKFNATSQFLHVDDFKFDFDLGETKVNLTNDSMSTANKIVQNFMKNVFPEYLEPKKQRILDYGAVFIKTLLNKHLNKFSRKDILDKVAKM